MRNVLTAGENSPRVVDHFPVSRASRWKQNQNGQGGVYDMMQMDLDKRLDDGSGAPPTTQLPMH